MSEQQRDLSASLTRLSAGLYISAGADRMVEPGEVIMEGDEYSAKGAGQLSFNEVPRGMWGQVHQYNDLIIRRKRGN